MVCVLIKMGGKGVRFGAEVPKQFYEINGEPLFAYVLRKYNEVREVDRFIVVTNEQWLDYTREYAVPILNEKLLEIVLGGTTNLKSTYNGVMCAKKYLGHDDILLVHDVTDPIVERKAIYNVINEAKLYQCAAVITEQVHTLYTKDEKGFITGTIEKHSVGSGYSPEAFRFPTILQCCEAATEYELEEMTSAMSLVQAHGIAPKTVVSHQLDLKITYQEDMEALKAVVTNGERLFR